MDVIKKLTANMLAVILSRIATPALNFMLFAYIARVLGKDGLGVYSFVITYCLIFQSISTMGINLFIPRDVARDQTQANKYLIHTGLIEIAASSCFIILMLAIAYLMHHSNETMLLVVIIAFSLVPFSLSTVCESIFIAFQRAKYIAYVKIIEGLVRVLLSFAMLLLGYGVRELIMIIAATSFIAMICNIYFLIKYVITPRWELDANMWGYFIKTAIVFGLIDALSVIHLKIDIVMISVMKSMSDVGIYNAACRIIDIFLLVLGSLFIVLIPAISNLDRDRLDRICHIALKYLLTIFLPIGFAISLLSGKLIIMIYGDQFVASINVLRIIVWLLIPLCFGGIFGRVLHASNNQKLDLWAVLSCTMFNIILNLLLIPKYSYIGASIASVSSLFFGISLQYYFFLKRVFKVYISKIILKPFISVILISIGSYVMKNKMDIWFLTTIAIFFYVFFIILLKVVDKEDLYFIGLIKRSTQ